jgi:RNA polymerase sigma-70 factor (ECF subfamily)
MFTGKGLWKKEQMKLARQSGMDFSDRREFQIDLAACGSAMPESLWEVFVLREALGVESDEICKRLEITPTNLWTRLHRARAALRDCLSAKGWWGGVKGKGKSAAT